MNGTNTSSSSEPQLNIESATATTYAAIRRMIVTGELPPGEKLKIESLKARLDTGASPIREALSLLTSDQLVERIDRRGFRAAPVSEENFVEILNLRCVLEDMALRQSIANADDAWEENLVLSHHRMAREDRNSESYEELHKQFHMMLLANCNAPILMRYCSQLYDLNVRYRYLAGRTLSYVRRDVADEHAAILDAAIKRQTDLASARLLEHYQQTGAFLKESPMEAEG